MKQLDQIRQQNISLKISLKDTSDFDNIFNSLKKKGSITGFQLTYDQNIITMTPVVIESQMNQLTK